MNGQSTNKGGFVNVPGGAQVLFSTTGVVGSYRHTDWLGSKRLVTGVGRVVTLDVAYAPYGEQYANTVGTNYNFTGMDNDTKSDLFDFPAREYHPTQGRWISPDPAGMAAVDPTNPQSWNRYAYVGNTPLTSTDPLGLEANGCATGELSWCLGSGYTDSGYCPPGRGNCGDGSWGPDLSIIISIGDGGGGGSSGGGVTGGSGAGSSGGGGGSGGKGGSGGGSTGPTGGENLGIPSGWRLPTGNMLDILNPTPDCEFGVCTTIGDGFQSGAEAIGAAACLSDPPCAALLVGTAAILVHYYGPTIIQMAKGFGKQNVGHDYVRDLAKALGGDYCTALKTIMNKARKSGDSKLFNDAKATYKQDCRGQ